MPAPKQSWMDRIPIGYIVAGWAATMAVIIGLVVRASLGGGRQ